MKSRKVFPRLTPLLLAALLLSFPGAAAAQRRRRHARTPARPASPAPTRTQTAPPPGPPAQTTPSTQTQPTPAPARADAQAQPARRAEPERSIEEMLSADGYAVYAEVRRVGTLARSEELKAAVGLFGLLGDEVRPATEPVTDLFRFVSDNAEALAEARAVLTFMPTRAGLPQALVALELPSAETAAAFEPKFRSVVGQQSEVVESILGAQGGPPRAPAARRGAARGATERGAARGAEKSPDAQGFVVRRFGRLLLAAESPFTLRRLRGEEGASALAESVRFQSVRGRFSSDSVFVYVDTTLAQQGYAVQRQKAEEAREAQPAGDRQANEQYDVTVRRAEGPSAAQPQPSASPSDGATLSATVTPTASPTPASAATNATAAATGGQASAAQTPEPSPPASPSPQDRAVARPVPTPEQPADEEGDAAEASLSATVAAEEKKAAASGAEAANASKPSEEQATVWRMGGVLRSVWEGAPRVPGAVALGLSLSGGSLAARLAVENTPDGVVSLIPFLPNIVSGPPVTAAAAQVAPDDADIFFTTSLDWTQIYNATLGAASLNPERLVTSWEETEEGDVTVVKPRAGEKVPTAEEAVAAAEKLFGFKFREDLLPALGNEVAVSLPLDVVSRGYMIRKLAEKKKEKDSEPGIAFIVSLNNPDKVREILPRVLTALNFVSYGAAFAPPEKREGFEIRSLGGSGGLSYTIIENFLIVSDEVKAVRHVIDSYAARRTLAARDAYRDSTEWQARQKLAQVYVSEALTRSAAESTRKISGGSTDPLVRGLLAQLDVRPEPASYEVTNEGDVLVHEARLPLSLIKVYAVSAMIGMKDAPAVAGEATAIYALNRIQSAEEAFRLKKKKERYGTLEELVGEQLLEKDFIARLEYKVELEASGDRFEATATPKNYGKTGRRSFFVGEDGVVRGADHKGEPATSDDPPID